MSDMHADYPPELTRALRHLRTWEGDQETYRAVTLLLAAFDDRDVKLADARARLAELEAREAIRAGGAEPITDADLDRVAELEAEVERLRAVADLARSYFRIRPGRIAVEIRSALVALDAAPAGTAAEDENGAGR